MRKFLKTLIFKPFLPSKIRNDLNISTEKGPKTSSSQLRCGCIALGGGCFTLILLFGGLPLFFSSLLEYSLGTRSGEHLPRAKKYSSEATDYSFYYHFMRDVCEFSISEKAYWEMCRSNAFTGELKPIAIESLQDLPPFDHKSPYPWINFRRDVPQDIARYVSLMKPEHEHCRGNAGKCLIDPTGKTIKVVSVPFLKGIITNGVSITVAASKYCMTWKMVGVTSMKAVFSLPLNVRIIVSLNETRNQSCPIRGGMYREQQLRC